LGGGLSPLQRCSRSLHSQDSEFSNADQMDLYDDVLAASSQPAESRTSSSEAPPEIRQEPSPKPNSKSPAILYTYSGLRNKRAAVYVGSFSWWTTDQQLIQTIRSVGVYDVVELKFAENRANGQSKGYAEVVVASENSVHKLLELLPGKILNGDKVEVRLATRQNLSQFEAQARKRDRDLRTLPSAPVLAVIRCLAAPRAVSRCPDPPSRFSGAGVFPSPAPHLTGHGEAEFRPPARLSSHQPLLPARQRPRLNGRARWGAVAPPRGSGRGSALRRLSPVSSSKPLWTQQRFLSLSSGADGCSVFLPPAAPLLSPLGFCPLVFLHTQAFLNPCADRRLSGFEEIMNRNRAISSSAISKAVSGASAGDYSDAIETLLTAIAVIKQSRVANDERCRVLLSSLKDCLHGIEAKSYSTSASSSSSRKRHRSRERSPSRSRESSRRHRDLLHSEDRHEDYFQERNREHERHRDRDRERDR
ncbi:CPSF7 factor, partial [Chionis minor]|nr:CPSF7 factor [Chionis minor]